MASKGIQHPNAFPALRRRPPRLNGIPNARDNFPLADEMPKALFIENEKPNFLIGQYTCFYWRLLKGMIKNSL